MSLVILSNTKFESVNNVDVIPRGLDRAFSFTNNLQTPLVIPKDSQVALQSLKMNKDGLFSVGRFNSTMYQYIGKKLTESFTYDESPRHPALIRVDPYGQYNTDDYVENALKPNMETGIYHPDLQGQTNASVKRSSGTTFEGFNLTYDKLGSASGVNNRPDEDSNPTNEANFVKGTLDSEGWEYTATNHRFHKRSGNGSTNPRAFAQISSAPLSCCLGNFQVHFSDAANWSIGLSRYCHPQAIHIAPDRTKVFRYFESPPYWKKNGLGFYDYVASSEKNVVSEKYELRLYHTVVKDTGSEVFLEYKEVDYWNASNAPHSGGPYNLTDNASSFNRITFTLDGEAVDVTMTKGGAANRTKICSPSYQVGSAKSTYFKPICQSNTYLYGKMEIKPTEASDRQGDYLTINEYDARIITGFNYDGYDTSKSNALPLNQRLTNHDWYATLLNLQRSKYLKDVDTRIYNDMAAADHSFVRTSGGKIAYDVIPIVSESQRYRPTLGANMSEVLGFTGYTTIEQPSSTNGSAVTFSSTTIPKLISNESVFVRLNNLTQLSTNGATGNQSKIIYHCPRFDNAGNETGGLFFEAAEKTYIDINNPGDIQVGDFSIDIVGKDEKFVKSVVGSTIVVLHIRQKPKHLIK